jgi:hypothetical protein
MNRRFTALALLLLTACRDFHDSDPGTSGAPDAVDAAAAVDADAGSAPAPAACTNDAQCEATLVGLPPCRVARCDTATGGCEVEWLGDGTPCLPEGASCGGECAGGDCVPACR